VRGRKFLQRPHPSEAEHRPFASSERLVGLLGPIGSSANSVMVATGSYDVALNAAHGTEEHPSVAPSDGRPLGQQGWGSLGYRGREPCGATMSLLWGRLQAAA